ncbi:hypothetical protein ACH5RR_007025 [Cinchona calisaya]|uniref:Gnk2-homologous domain-containing protein n=1 Tax=Cinchona calisaya TaxID=153742 RepID=A0ABD3AQK8_9GENT
MQPFDITGLRSLRGGSVDYVLDVLLTATAKTPRYNALEQPPFTDYNALAYGHGTCRGSLAATDCAMCILAAYNNIGDLCNGNIGGRVYLNDVTIRKKRMWGLESGCSVTKRAIPFRSMGCR